MFTENMSILYANGSTEHITGVAISDNLRCVHRLPDRTTFGEVRVVDVDKTVQDSHVVINGSLSGGKEAGLLVNRDYAWSWVNMAEIKVGDKLMSETKNFVDVVSVEQIDSPIPVISLIVDQKDSYIVGTPNMMVVACTLG